MDSDNGAFTRKEEYMLEIKEYRRVGSLEEAWTLNQKKSNRVIGGMLWLKQSRARINTAIDLSGLGVDQIEEHADCFRIGCMVTLRQLETSEALNRYACDAIRDAVRWIVGVQFRNLATIGGSIFGRYGFSDVLTVFMAMGAEAELYRGGRVPLWTFVNRTPDRDILSHIRLPREEGSFAYLSVRNTKTDLPVLNTAAAVSGEGLLRRLVVGARPQKAMPVPFPAEQSLVLSEENIRALAALAGEMVPTGDNMRGSAAYRSHLVQVLGRRVMKQALLRGAVQSAVQGAVPGAERKEGAGC